jgi:hypothetical protein
VDYRWPTGEHCFRANNVKQSLGAKEKIKQQIIFTIIIFRYVEKIYYCTAMEINQQYLWYWIMELST